ncbi:MAG: hypothetical protein L0Y72_20735 [Gemmataceae bacterium]|nr:hypothetical protein [Gemmataceae bacterium]MCI0741467.1 hypothetical protein [Gemmataceae bacterium]
MRKSLPTSLILLPSVPVVFGFLVDLGLIPVSSSFAHPVVWWGTLAGWLVAVVLTAAIIKGASLLVHPFAIVILSLTILIGFAGYLVSSVLTFSVLFMLTLAASVVALAQGRSGVAEHRAFCRVFAVCTWLGLALTLWARAPIVGVSVVQSMWWYVTGHGRGFDGFDLSRTVWPNFAASWGTHYLCRTWPLALTAAWLAREYVVWRRKEHRPVEGHEGL